MRRRLTDVDVFVLNLVKDQQKTTREIAIALLENNRALRLYPVLQKLKELQLINIQQTDEKKKQCALISPTEKGKKVAELYTQLKELLAN